MCVCVCVCVCVFSSIYSTFNISVQHVAAWLSGNALVLINVVALRRARLVLGWVTVRGYTILVFNQSHPGLLSQSGRHNEYCLGHR